MTPEQLQAMSPNDLYAVYLEIWHQTTDAIAAHFGVDALTAMQISAEVDSLMSQYSVDGLGYFYLANVDDAGNVKYFPVGQGPEPNIRGAGGIVTNEPASTTVTNLTAPQITTSPSGSTAAATSNDSGVAPLDLGTLLLYAVGGYIALKMLKGL